MRRIFLSMGWLALLLLACTPDTPAAPMVSHGNWTGVIAAGDDTIPVFDNAALRLRTDLGVNAQIIRFSMVDRNAQAASVGGVLNAISALHPQPGATCLVYITSHGAHGYGLVFTRNNQHDVLPPAALAQALDQGCGQAPTVVVLSGCYSGIYEQQSLQTANRIILTAASADRPSFGCGAGYVYTVFDDCLLTALESNRGGTWRSSFARATACVTNEEQREGQRPSEPQSWFGAAVTDLQGP